MVFITSKSYYINVLNNVKHIRDILKYLIEDCDFIWGSSRRGSVDEFGTLAPFLILSYNDDTSQWYIEEKFSTSWTEKRDGLAWDHFHGKLWVDLLAPTEPLLKESIYGYDDVGMITSISTKVKEKTEHERMMEFFATPVHEWVKRGDR